MNNFTLLGILTKFCVSDSSSLHYDNMNKVPGCGESHAVHFIIGRMLGALLLQFGNNLLIRANPFSNSVKQEMSLIKRGQFLDSISFEIPKNVAFH